MKWLMDQRYLETTGSGETKERKTALDYVEVT